MGEEVRLNAYFERIGFAGSIAPTLATLEALHTLQPATIPFENLDPLLGLPIRLDQASLEHKLLDERRGGVCVELNVMLLRVLLELGFEARAHLAHVQFGSSDDHHLPPDHIVLTVDIAGTTWLTDVGFGGLLQTVPLKLRPGLEQDTPLGTYRIMGDGPAFQLEFRRGDEWWHAYRFDADAAEEGSTAAIATAVSKEPHGFLREHLLVEKASATGRSRLFDTRFTVEGSEGQEDRVLGSVAEIRETLAGVFGLVAGEGLDPALARLVTRTVTAG